MAATYFYRRFSTSCCFLTLTQTELASNKTSSALVCQWFDLCVEKWNEFDDDTKLQVKNVAIVQSKFSSVLFQFKNPMFE